MTQLQYKDENGNWRDVGNVRNFHFVPDLSEMLNARKSELMSTVAQYPLYLNKTVQGKA